MANPSTCWYCDFFDLQSGKTGHCRRYAPRAIDYQSVPGLTAEDGSYVFPIIPDATTEWCGEFKQARGPVPVPPA